MQQEQEFERELLALIGRPTELRPFVCDGSPLRCDAFIVGINPATALATDFWTFWREGYGFDKAAWLAAYRAERRLRPLKPGKTRRLTISPTRRVIEWIIEDAQPVPCLETNIWALPGADMRGVAIGARVAEPFDFLLATINPRVIVAHGKDVWTHMDRTRTDATIIKVKHFSRGWSQRSARTLGQQIRQVCDG
jgi:hypothetical protein